MSRLKLTEESAHAAVLGGCVLGGGGGGSMEDGLKMALLAVRLTSPELIDPEDLNEDAVLLNVSLVGAPSAESRHTEPIHYCRAMELLRERINRPVAGIITNEAGGVATVNGWLQSAMLGIPVVDAPCNGRAHPTGIMGAMGLHKEPVYQSIQAAVGGDPDKGKYLELTVSGSVQVSSSLIRQAAIQAGGLVAVARNPVSCAYAKAHGAPGAVKQAINLGQKMLAAKADAQAAGAKSTGGKAVLDAVCGALQGRIIHTGRVTDYSLNYQNGFDTGIERLDDLELSFWNEYMTAETASGRLGTFPDLIMTMNAETGMPITSNEVSVGQEIAVLLVPKKNLLLGETMSDLELLKGCEEAVGREMIRYITE